MNFTIPFRRHGRTRTNDSSERVIAANYSLIHDEQNKQRHNRTATRQQQIAGKHQAGRVYPPRSHYDQTHRFVHDNAFVTEAAMGWSADILRSWRIPIGGTTICSTVSDGEAPLLPSVAAWYVNVADEAADGRQMTVGAEDWAEMSCVNRKTDNPVE